MTHDGVVDVASVTVACDRVAPLLTGASSALPFAGRCIGRFAIAGRAVDQRQRTPELRHAFESLAGDVHAHHLRREHLRRCPRFFVR